MLKKFSLFTFSAEPSSEKLKGSFKKQSYNSNKSGHNTLCTYLELTGRERLKE